MKRPWGWSPEATSALCLGTQSRRPGAGESRIRQNPVTALAPVDQRTQVTPSRTETKGKPSKGKQPERKRSGSRMPPGEWWGKGALMERHRSGDGSSRQRFGWSWALSRGGGTGLGGALGTAESGASRVESPWRRKSLTRREKGRWARRRTRWEYEVGSESRRSPKGEPAYAVKGLPGKLGAGTRRRGGETHGP